MGKLPRVAVLCASLAVAMLTMTGCGGSSSTPPPGGPNNVAGDWMLTVSGGGTSVSGPGVITQSGQPVFFQTSPGPSFADTAVFPTISGSGSLSGTATVYATTGQGGQSQSQSVIGKVNSSTSITGTVANGNTFSMAQNSPLVGTVAALSGNMHGQFEGWYPYVWQISLVPSGQGQSTTINGTLTVPGGVTPECGVSGTLTQEGNLNVFDVSLTFVQGGFCPPNSSVTMSGPGFESSLDYFQLNGGAPGSYFYFATSNYGNVLEIFP
jgi:hypothetical protein